MDTHAILMLVYEIQGAADPNHPETVKDLKERMAEIFAKACEIMEKTGFEPD